MVKIEIQPIEEVLKHYYVGKQITVFRHPTQLYVSQYPAQQKNGCEPILATVINIRYDREEEKYFFILEYEGEIFEMNYFS